MGYVKRKLFEINTVKLLSILCFVHFKKTNVLLRDYVVVVYIFILKESSLAQVRRPEYDLDIRHGICR